LERPTLRPATPEDEEFLHQVYASTREEELAVVPWSPAEKDAFLRMQTRAQRVHYASAYPQDRYQVIEHHNQRVGRLLVHQDARRLHVVDVAVLTAFRGRGVGSAVLTDLQVTAARAGIPVTMSTEANNPARRLYDRMGFVVVEEHDLHVLLRWTPVAGPSRQS
jgi:ribosomal protein S18 acetylase RimI-like enzyme